MDTSEPVFVSDKSTISGSTSGALTVRDGGALHISGDHHGLVTVDGGATLEVSGTITGSLCVESLATATITGDIVGPVVVRVAATVVVGPEGRVAGALTNHGSFTNWGMRSGPVEGREPDDQPGAVNAEPLHPGVFNYTLPERA